jgi:hypothetical protein
MSYVKWVIGLILSALIVAAGIGFALLNPHNIQVDLGLIKFQDHSVAVYLLSAFGTGLMLGLFACLGIVVRLQSSLLLTKHELEKTRHTPFPLVTNESGS